MKARFEAPLVLVSLLAAAPGAAQDPWARVPAFPTACHTAGETYQAEVARATSDLQAAIEKQRELNEAAKERYRQIEPAEMQSRMMAFLSKNPQAAAKFMQDVATLGQRHGQLVQELADARGPLDERRKAVDAEHKRDWEAVGAIGRRFSEQMEPGGSTAKARAIGAEYQAGYQKYCAKWYGPASPFAAFLAALKQFHLDHSIPQWEGIASGERLQFEVLAIPAKGYQSTAVLESVVDYLSVAGAFAQWRTEEPLRLP